MADLAWIDWNTIAATDFRDAAVKEAKQAEFLVHEFFPWELVEEVGVHSVAIRAQAQAAISAASHQPRVDVRPRWYY